MNWLQKLLNLPRVGRTKPDSSRMWFVGATQSGAYVDQETALNYAAVWASVRVISETVAQLPWKTYRRTARGKKEAGEHPVAWLLHTQPNPESSAFRWKRAAVADCLVWGNAYAEIERDGSGRPLNLWPIHPSRVKVERDAVGDLVYRVRAQDNTDVILRAADVLHFRGIGDDDIVGTSVIAKARQSIGLGLAMESFGSSFFGNGTNMGGTLTHPGKLSKEARTNLEDSMRSRAGGKNALKTIVLEEGMKFERMGIPPEDAQFLESRTFQVLEVARWFRVPPHKLYDLSRATWNNIEHQSIEFVTDTIVPWTCNLEEEANLKLFGRQQRSTHYTKFALQALLRGDTASRFSAYATARQWGWLSVNDIRELEDMNPITGGNQYLVPSNMTTPAKLEEAPAPGAAKPGSPREPAPEPEDDPPPPGLESLQPGQLLNKARTP